MLLRRVIEHVKVQNWTAVVLDFVIEDSSEFVRAFVVAGFTYFPQATAKTIDEMTSMWDAQRRAPPGKAWSPICSGTSGNSKRGNDITIRNTPTPMAVRVLSKLGRRTGKGNRWTQSRVASVLSRIKAKILSANQVTPYAPLEIKREDLDSEPVASILAHLKSTGKLMLEGDTSGQQPSLFQDNQSVAQRG